MVSLKQKQISLSIRRSLAGASLALGVVGSLGFAPGAAAGAFDNECSDAKDVRAALQDVLGKGLSAFHLQSLDGATLNRQLQKGAVEFSLPDPKNALQKVGDVAAPRPLIGAAGPFGALKRGESQPVNMQRIDPNAHFMIGECSNRDVTCGILSVLDRDWYEVEGFVLDKGLGFSFFEPVNNLLAAHGSKVRSKDPSCHVMYNAAAHGALSFPALKGGKSYAAADAGDSFQDQVLGYLQKAGDFLISPSHAIEMAVGYYDVVDVYLDADGSFYDLDPATVWTRQASVIAGVNEITSRISRTYRDGEDVNHVLLTLEFNIKGQESWVPSYGPSTRDGLALLEEINDPGYFMVFPPADKELSYFFVGYDVNEPYAVRAGGVCSYRADAAGQRNHAWGQQVAEVRVSDNELATFYARTLAAAHGLGAMMGGVQEDAQTHRCLESAPEICGSTIMLSSNNSFDANFRVPLYSPDNLGNLLGCLH